MRTEPTIGATLLLGDAGCIIMTMYGPAAPKSSGSVNVQKLVSWGLFLKHIGGWLLDGLWTVSVSGSGNRGRSIISWLLVMYFSNPQVFPQVIIEITKHDHTRDI